jgi:triosephosphate isomerase
MNGARRPLIAGNWKMNAGGADGCELAADIAKATADHAAVEVVVGPPFTALAAVSHELREKKSPVGVAAQNMHNEASGAFTGEVSADMLKVAGAGWVILGHSERRQLFGDSNDWVAQKLATAIAAELRPIVCVGETLDQREAGQTLEVVGEQLSAVLEELKKAAGEVVVAYEPVWAIGTGKVASPDDAQEVHAAIRKQLGEASDELGHKTRILYGGSVKPNNAEGLLAQADIDGALVGGAALKSDSFAKIVEIAAKLAEQEQTG